MGYTKEWWEENKDEVLGKRRRRYQDDPEHRAEVLARARAYRARKKAERAAAPQVVTLPDGSETPGFTLAEIASYLGVPEEKIKYYQKQGYIPPALVVRPHRLYTKRQRALLKKLTAFLTEHGTYLRRPQSDKGAVAVEKLNALVATINTDWTS